MLLLGATGGPPDRVSSLPRTAGVSAAVSGRGGPLPGLLLPRQWRHEGQNVLNHYYMCLFIHTCAPHEKAFSILRLIFSNFSM